MRRPRLLVALIAVAYLACVAPTLAWLEFSSGGENLLVSTVIEMRLTGAKVIPTLNGEKRVRKPPLPAWAADALLPGKVADELARAAPGPVRDAAYRRLAGWLRAPAVLMSAVLIVLVYEIGRTAGSDRIGVLAALASASSLLLLRYGRGITTDIHLALWVTLANLGLLRVLFGGRPGCWLPIAGAAAGLGFLSKGPVALLMIAPGIVALMIRRQSVGPRPVAAAMLAFTVVAAPWFVHVAWTTPEVWPTWWTEISRQGATTLKPDPWFSYASIFLMLAPWSVAFVTGMAAGAARGSSQPAGWIALLMLLLPVVVMSLVKDKNERYLLPLIAPAAMLCAVALRSWLAPPAGLPSVTRLAIVAHWALLLGISVGVPVAGAVAWAQPDQRAWWSAWTAAALAAILAGAWLLAVLLWRRRAVMLPVGTAMLMFTCHTLFLKGYRQSLSGRSEMKPIADDIARLRPGARVVFFDTKVPPKPIPQDLQIYLNRVVRFVGSAKELPPATRDAVIVVQQRDGQPEPALPGYRRIAAHPWGRRAWHAFSGD